MKSYGDKDYKMPNEKDAASGEMLPVLYRRNGGLPLTRVGWVVKHRTGYAVMANNLHTAIILKADVKFSFPTVREAQDAMWRHRDDFKATRSGFEPTPKEVFFAAE